MKHMTNQSKYNIFQGPEGRGGGGGKGKFAFNNTYFMSCAGDTFAIAGDRAIWFVLFVVMQTMVIPEEREGKTDDDPNLSRDTTAANATVNTRKGGKQETVVQHKVEYRMCDRY